MTSGHQHKYSDRPSNPVINRGIQDLRGRSESVTNSDICNYESHDDMVLIGEKSKFSLSKKLIGGDTMR